MIDYSGTMNVLGFNEVVNTCHPPDQNWCTGSSRITRPPLTSCRCTNLLYEYTASNAYDISFPPIGISFVLGTGIRMEVCVRNLVVRGFHWTTGSDCGPKPFLRHMSVHLTVWRSKGPYNRPYFIWLLSNQIGCEQPDLVHEGIPAYSYKTCFCERKIAPSLIETPPL